VDVSSKQNVVPEDIVLRNVIRMLSGNEVRNTMINGISRPNKRGSIPKERCHYLRHYMSDYLPLPMICTWINKWSIPFKILRSNIHDAANQHGCLSYNQG